MTDTMQSDHRPEGGIAAVLRPSHLLIASVFGILLLTALLTYRLASAPPAEAQIAGYTTSLKGRTDNQRYNARLAAEMLDGAVVPPGSVFSFNRRVKSWTADRGYVRAPVSYEGELVRAFGGGVCQTSTTLYNAALLAGLPIVERHPHVFATHYAPPGRDAAVAQYTVDLRFRNPYAWPITIRASGKGEQLTVRIIAPKRPAESVRISADILDATEPSRFVNAVNGDELSFARRRARAPGMTGYRVITYRVFSSAGREVRRERLSDDTYPPMHRIVRIVD